MNKQNRTTNPSRPIKAVINPGRQFTAPVVPEWTIAVADRLAAAWAHLAPALHAAAVREEAAAAARSTIETINDGPRCLGWHFVPGRSAPKSLLRTGWHAVGEPCPRVTSDAILSEVRAARDAYLAAAAPLLAAARTGGLSDYATRDQQVTAWQVVRRVQQAALSEVQ